MVYRPDEKPHLTTQALETAQQLLDLSNRDRDKISELGRATASTLAVHRELMEHPIATSGRLVEKTGITPATVNKALGIWNASAL